MSKTENFSFSAPFLSSPPGGESVFLRPIRKLATFSLLTKGWNFGEGKVISKQNIEVAHRLLVALIREALLPMDAFPGLDGDVRITVYFGQDYFEFTIESKKKIHFVFERQNTLVEEKECHSLEEVLNLYEKNLGKIKKWNTSDSSIPSSMIQPEEDFKVRFSKARPESLCSFTNVLSSDPGPFVTTLANSTAPYSQHQISF